MKTCKTCRIELPIECFYKESKGTNYRTSCKKCLGIIQSERRRINRETFSGNIAASKTCKRCHEEKPSEDFYLNRSIPSGLGAYCKPCQKQNSKESLANRDPEALKTQSRRGHIRRTYGLSMHDFDAMLESQRGLCSICECILEKPFVDHDHATGVVRDLLCATCNSGLGMFGDDTDLMFKAIEYLKRHYLNPTSVR